MICIFECPRGTKCRPLANVVSTEADDFVCVGIHGEEKHGDKSGDKFRHCFKSVYTDSMYDYDHYDLLSVAAVINDALLIDFMEEE